ncbi:hypothetical protein DSL72_002017 [Monilinia vaccinii-corymbosi]|uniref:Uncharacterized protein n=1 Tax=Monilinia vaccinii-corymbosi TaxID=61207 RepID=A0A8A3PBH2_9HELO|nr:hypothetical protein DSL72_002017 [Monilinia vaccinii-corymbosi]
MASGTRLCWRKLYTNISPLINKVASLILEARSCLEVLNFANMGQESSIMAVMIIVLTVLGGAVAFLLWHRLCRSRRLDEAIEMRHVQERGPGRHRARERGTDGRRVREHDPNGPSIAGIVRGSPGHPAGGTTRNEQRSGLSLADILDTPPRRSAKSAGSPLKKGNKGDTSGGSQDSPRRADAERSPSGPTTHVQQSAGSAVWKGKGKPAPGKLQIPAVNPENSDTSLIRVESSPSFSQDESSIGSER